MRQWAEKQHALQNRLKNLNQSLLEHQSLHSNRQNPTYEVRIVEQINKAEEDLALYWKHRSRVQLQLEGDRNTSYFHLVATQRRRVNMINQVRKVDGTLVVEETEIRRAFVQYYKAIYCRDLTQQENPAPYFEELQLAPFPKIPQSEHPHDDLFPI